ncbi:hypothetical protein [Curtobacterium sp. BRD11]|jgi:hypothetical protein|nr:hypothetical protein [Curtobacterium sp. BRD11]MDT0211204.1 hypothetical protein [Curtobacterium sp. BRD11]
MTDVFAAFHEAEREFLEHLRTCNGCSKPEQETADAYRSHH